MNAMVIEANICKVYKQNETKCKNNYKDIAFTNLMVFLNSNMVRFNNGLSKYKFLKKEEIIFSKISIHRIEIFPMDLGKKKWVSKQQTIKPLSCQTHWKFYIEKMRFFSSYSPGSGEKFKEHYNSVYLDEILHWAH